MVFFLFYSQKLILLIAPSTECKYVFLLNHSRKLKVKNNKEI